MKGSDYLLEKAEVDWPSRRLIRGGAPTLGWMQREAKELMRLIEKPHKTRPKRRS